MKEVGYVIRSKYYFIHLEGLPSARIHQILTTKDGHKAVVMALGTNWVEAVLLHNYTAKPGDEFFLDSLGIRIPVGDFLVGRTIDPLGNALDGKKPWPTLNETTSKLLELEISAPGISRRNRISQQLITGKTIIDSLLPIGKGQRQLIFGEPRSGKTSLLLDTILSQKKTHTICIYAAIGKSVLDMKQFTEDLEKNGAESYSLVVAGLSNESSPVVMMTPITAFSIAEYFRDRGIDVLLILDDLGVHARIIREIALLSERVPGRESFPGNIFYEQAHLIERAGNFTSQKSTGSVSITLLPLIETDLENFTTLIPTNLMASTDGHLLFSSSQFAAGYYPAIDINRSVTRVGRQTQTTLVHRLADKIRLLLSDYHDAESYSRFGSELTQKTRTILKQGEITVELLKQEPLEYIPQPVQLLMLSLIFTNFFQNHDVDFVRRYKKQIRQALATAEPFVELSKITNEFTFDNLIAQLEKNLAVLDQVCQ